MPFAYVSSLAASSSRWRAGRLVDTTVSIHTDRCTRYLGSHHPWKERAVRQLWFVKPGLLEWRDVAEPRLDGPGAALVRPIASTTCDIDQWIVQGESPFAGPFAIGHECVAQVLAVGDDVRVARAGALVVLPWHVSCGTCDRCAHGQPAYCRTTPPTASYGLPFGGQWGGLFDEVVRVPYADAMLTPIPTDIEPSAVAAAGDNLTIPIELLGEHLRRRSDPSVLVLGRRGAGGGSVSLYAADVARALGATRVLYLDPDPRRRQVADRFGAETDAGPPRRDLGRFDIVFDCSTSPQTLKAAIELLTPNGVVECPGGYFRPVELDLFRMYVQGVTIHTGLANAGQYVGTAMELIRRGLITPSAVFTDTFPIDMAAEVLAEPSTKPLFLRDPLPVESHAA
jgi:alcohol dehydrogenase